MCNDSVLVTVFSRCFHLCLTQHFRGEGFLQTEDLEIKTGIHYRADIISAHRLREQMFSLSSSGAEIGLTSTGRESLW